MQLFGYLNTQNYDFVKNYNKDPDNVNVEKINASNYNNVSNIGAKEDKKAKNINQNKNSNIDGDKDKNFFRFVFDKSNNEIKDLKILNFNIEENLDVKKSLDLLIHKMMSGKVDFIDKNNQISNQNNDLILINIFMALSRESFDLMLKDDVDLETIKLQENIINMLKLDSDYLNLKKELNFEILNYIINNFIDYKSAYKETNKNNNFYYNDKDNEECKKNLNELNSFDEVFESFDNKIMFESEKKIVFREKTNGEKIKLEITYENSFTLIKDVKKFKDTSDKLLNGVFKVTSFLNSIQNPFFNNMNNVSDSDSTENLEPEEESIISNIN